MLPLPPVSRPPLYSSAQSSGALGEVEAMSPSNSKEMLSGMLAALALPPKPIIAAKASQSKSPLACLRTMMSRMDDDDAPFDGDFITFFLFADFPLGRPKPFPFL